MFKQKANFVENLTVDMIIAYDNGSLVEVIFTSLKENIDIYNQSTSLFGDIDEYPAQIVKDIFAFVCLRLIKMRGQWLFNNIRAEHGGKSKSVDNFSTRGRVIAKL